MWGIVSQWEDSMKEATLFHKYKFPLSLFCIIEKDLKCLPVDLNV